MNTFIAKPGEEEAQWFVVDAADQVLGRLATRVATILRGKHKKTFTPHVDGGDFVIVINAEKVLLTGNKLDQKLYYRHTGHPGGLKTRTAKQMLSNKPEEVFRHAIKGMLPKNRLGSQILTKLKVYSGPHIPIRPNSLDR